MCQARFAHQARLQSKPRLLDLFCGAGGAGMGYYRAGFDVVGVDISPQKHYPFEFHQEDALEYLRLHGHEFDAVHASPPCQRYSVCRTIGTYNPQEYPDLVGPIRDLLAGIGKPFVIENVPGAPLLCPVTLCGSMFPELCTPEGNQLRRHRLFECWFPICMDGMECRHNVTGRRLPTVGVYGHSGGSSNRDGVKFFGIEAWRQVMGIDWMTSNELSQAIPPAYTKFIGDWLIRAVEGSRLTDPTPSLAAKPGRRGRWQT